MLFGLQNAPSTFQSLMNEVLRPYLRKFVLVFLYDTLIYRSVKDHIEHLRVVLQTLTNDLLVANGKKCVFAVPQVKYLGHVVSAEGVAADSSKVCAMQQ